MSFVFIGPLAWCERCRLKWRPWTCLRESLSWSSCSSRCLPSRFPLRWSHRVFSNCRSARRHSMRSLWPYVCISKNHEFLRTSKVESKPIWHISSTGAGFRRTRLDDFLDLDSDWVTESESVTESDSDFNWLWDSVWVVCFMFTPVVQKTISGCVTKILKYLERSIATRSLSWICGECSMNVL